MNLVEELQAKSDEIEQDRNAIVAEIRSGFEKYIAEGGLEHKLKSITKQDTRALLERETTLIVGFCTPSEYYSDPYFTAAGFTWTSPEPRRNSTKRMYKGIPLKVIYPAVVEALTSTLQNALEQMGFSTEVESYDNSPNGEMVWVHIYW